VKTINAKGGILGVIEQKNKVKKKKGKTVTWG